MIDETPMFSADNINYITRCRWVVEHYWRVYDADNEAALEQAILTNFGPFEKTEAWVEEENCAQTAYYFTEIGD